MMTAIVRGLSRVAFYLLKVVMRPLEAARPRLYMRLWLKVLAAYGMRFTGTPRYLASAAYYDDFRLVTLGDRTVVSSRVILLTHDYSVTTGLIAIGEAPPTDVAVHRPITIGNNVFIGMGSILLPGTTIGDNVIVAAGSVVRGTIPSDALVLGNPATVVDTLTGRADRWRALSRGEHASSDAE
jgi:carbonic anhydrase/acetyltransferase-like protein (isoleucine patch superfamily)